MSDGDATKEGGQVIEARYSAKDGARFKTALGDGHPSFCNFIEGESGVGANREIPDLGSKFSKASIRELAVLGSERPAKWLVTPFHGDVIAAVHLH